MAHGGEVPGRGAWRGCEREGQRRLHAAPPRRSQGRQRDDHVSHLQGRRCDRRGPQRTDDGRYGQRTCPACVAVPGDGRAPREARLEEQPQVCDVLTQRCPDADGRSEEPVKKPERLRSERPASILQRGIRTRAKIVTLAAGLASFAPAADAAAQSHTLVVLSHSNHTVYELDPASGRILHEFVAPDQTHEGAITSDGATVFASVPAASLVEILDGKTFKEKGRIESEYFKRPPQARAAGRGPSTGSGRAGGELPPNTSASPHGVSLNNDNSKLYIGVENAVVPGVVVYDIKAGRVIKKIDL